MYYLKDCAVAGSHIQRKSIRWWKTYWLDDEKPTDVPRYLAMLIKWKINNFIDFKVYCI